LILRTKPDADISLRRASGGVFEITVDGSLRYSKKATGRFPSADEVLGATG
jgi:selT/selW/selH-like putative selenoprotein